MVESVICASRIFCHAFSSSGESYPELNT
jgi:hypothetical protein